MNPNEEAAAIAAVLTTADPDAVVYDHQKLPGAKWDAFIEAFSKVGADGKRRIRTLTVEYLGEDRQPKVIAIGSRKIRRVVSWVVRVHLSWQDAANTEAIFRDLLVALVAALDADPTKGGAFIDSDPCDVLVPNNGAGIALGDYLCHYGELSFTAYAEETVATTAAP